MTDDLVKRLRKVEPDTPGERTRWYRNPDGPEAADEIERLRRANSRLVDALSLLLNASSEDEHDAAEDTARAALGEKKDG
jgi:hypothetical protein